MGKIKFLHKLTAGFLIVLILGVMISFGFYIVKWHNVINRMKYIEPTLAILDVEGDSVYIVRNVSKKQDTIKTDKAKLDSLIVLYNQRVRGLERAITRQREENNTIMDRSSAWLAFWLSFLAIVLAVPGFFSIIQTHRSNIKIKEEMDKIEPALQKNRKEVKDCISQAKKKLASHLNNSKIAQAESKINSLMSCVNHVLEPGIYGRSSDIDELLRYYLKRLENELSGCIKYIVEKGKLEEMDINSFPIILFELQTIFDKIQMLNTDMKIGLYICEYIDFLSKARTNLMNNISIYETINIQKCLTELEKNTKRVVEKFICSGRINAMKYDIKS